MIKRNLLLLFMATALILSCSKDKDEDTQDESSIEGTWEMSELRYDESTDNDDLKFAKEIADKLISEGCDLITLTFNADGTLITESKVENFDISAGPGGLIVPCPTEKDTEVTNWSLDGDQLTFTDSDGMEETITIGLTGNTMVIAGEQFDANNYVGSEIVFTKK